MGVREARVDELLEGVVDCGRADCFAEDDVELLEGYWGMRVSWRQVGRQSTQYVILVMGR